LITWAVATLGGVVLAATVVTPYAEQLAATPSTSTGVDAARAAHILVQAAFFTAMGMVLSAFTAAVAGRIGGLRTEEMQAKGRA
jgi:hypothetical protein